MERSSEAKNPGAQLWQAAFPLTVISPSTQAVQLAEVPALAHADGQERHVRVVLSYIPGKHWSQLRRAESVVHPSGHGLQLNAPLCSLNQSSGHVAHPVFSVTCPAKTPHLPLGQEKRQVSTLLVCRVFVLPEYCPRGHGSHKATKSQPSSLFHHAAGQLVHLLHLFVSSGGCDRHPPVTPTFAASGTALHNSYSC